ncbi:diacylglycerol/lipid kinase family protein [Dinghuibacter silviterrae]|uniref:Diacylglycerol kinase family enzyme n=1 Tax=Dinghuibacter silviterrae TaxID=1539049 RepID=A0A4R8DUI8_9BACT|nr:diacylglycerol kinase family protein [Dinghuibacter silviterrae]TDX01125.1 diacylglycerol kinase family enzyme [Dinghuibacter silviterrae]
MHREEKILFVVNPAAGGRDKSLFWTCLEQALAIHAFDHLTYRTTGENDVQELRHLLAGHAFTRVIVVGGDGTAKMVAEQLVHSPIALGIIPMGSANGMARELGLPSSIKDALRVALGPNTTYIDTIHLQGHGLCIHLCDLGLNASLVERYAKEGFRGMWGYGRLFVSTVLQRNRFRIYVSGDHFRYNRNVYMLMLANARKFGTGALINPLGSPRDGRFEVIMMKDFRWWDLPRLFLPHRKQHLEREEVVSVQSVSIACNRAVHFQVDGEYKGKIKRLKASVIAQSLRVLVPERLGAAAAG